MGTSLTIKEIEKIKNGPTLRRETCRRSHRWFFSIYLAQYLTYPFADLHQEIFQITEDASLKLATILAFRGSGKSTLLTLSYPIWSIIGVQRKKFVLILTQTQYQAKQYLANIKKELMGNELLKADVGPFEEFSDEWGASSIVLSRYDARITATSIETSIRGLRHRERRPDLVIIDDPEDLNSVKTKEGRDKVHQWLTGEVIPIGDWYTKYLVVGNLLHEDCLIMRLKRGIEEGKLEGKFLSYPLLDSEDHIAWPGKFVNMEEVEKLKRLVGNEIAWQREYLLRIVPNELQIVHRDWIHLYDELPSEANSDYRFIAMGIDVAISQESWNDFTAMVCAMVCGYKENLKVYILPNPLNKRLDFPQTEEQIKDIAFTTGQGYLTKIFIEDVGYQKALVDDLKKVHGLQAEGVKVRNQDKSTRLTLTTPLIQSGKIMFPRLGAESLIQQLVGFGSERYDDLADAFSILIIGLMTLNSREGQTFFTDLEGHGNTPGSSNRPDSEIVNLRDVGTRVKYEREADRKIMRENFLKNRQL